MFTEDTGNASIYCILTALNSMFITKEAVCLYLPMNLLSLFHPLRHFSFIYVLFVMKKLPFHIVNDALLSENTQVFNLGTGHMSSSGRFVKWYILVRQFVKGFIQNVYEILIFMKIICDLLP